MSTETTSIEQLKEQHSAAKERLKDARFMEKQGETVDVAAIKREVDRIGAQVRRAEKSAGTATNGAKSANGKGNTSTLKSQAKKATSAAKTTAKKAAAKVAKKAAELTAADFAEPVKLGKVGKEVKNPTSVSRQPKGEKIRVCFRNKETKSFVSIIDATLDNRFKKYADQGRWITLEMQTGEAAAHKTWEGAWFFARVPSAWSDTSAEMARKGETFTYAKKAAAKKS